MGPEVGIRGRVQEVGGDSPCLGWGLGLEGETGGPPKMAPSMNRSEGREENRLAICFAD